MKKIASIALCIILALGNCKILMNAGYICTIENANSKIGTRLDNYLSMGTATNQNAEKASSMPCHQSKETKSKTGSRSTHDCSCDQERLGFTFENLDVTKNIQFIKFFPELHPFSNDRRIETSNTILYKKFQYSIHPKLTTLYTVSTTHLII
ncbi:hypothetical protein [Leptospira sp. GIMC2001]|uniref:hypothetical protein n=1 Tax=Leptospira sp. GIMC2001 TaxID=1513297 RepID=UPI00234A2436|nr:hypothetical protein [Leptospira sp. GIMC2001]WCL50469.1 hypothetical protein O4O04_06510 [Leptospira sp. GIMC2001]